MGLHEDCYHYYEDVDMHALVPNCMLAKNYGECPCDNCNKYITRKEVAEIVRLYQASQLAIEKWKKILSVKEP